MSNSLQILAGSVTTAVNGSVVTLQNVSIEVNDGKIINISPIDENTRTSGKGVLDRRGCLVTPGFIDAHTHLFPPTDRAAEFAMRPIKSYLEIAAAGGGILSTVKSFRESSIEDIVSANRPLMQQFFAQGTTTVEVKSGYGLTTKDELNALEAIKILREEFADRLTIVPTFMGAHAIPPEYKGRDDEYVTLVCDEMIPIVAKAGLATYCDVFCEKGYFSTEQTRRILQAAKDNGMETRIHADEFVDGGGAALAAAMGSHSADHLMAVSEDGMTAMAKAGVIPIVLPGATMFLGKGHSTAPMRALIEAGCKLAVATDHNPGSSVNQSMPQMMQLCIAHGKISVEEALLAATIHAAQSLAMGNQVGSIEVGKAADFLVWNLDCVQQIPYYGSESRHRLDSIIKNGKVFSAPGETSNIVNAMHADTCKRKADAKIPPITRALAPKKGKVPTETANGYASSTELAAIIYGFVGVDDFTNQITRLPEGWKTAAKTFYDPNVPHAPKRKLGGLSTDEQVMAVDNHLKYFHGSLHAELRPILEAELAEYGHIYCYFLLPAKHVSATPFGDLPAEKADSRCMMHMILNNLDPAVAQFPQELITYGGNGAVFNNWAQFYITFKMMKGLQPGQTLSMHSGHPAGLWPTNSDQVPSAVITNGMMIPHYSTPNELDRTTALGVSMYGQMTAGSWMYIGPQGIVHGTTLTVASGVEMQANMTGASNDPKGKIFLTSGLGGMSGAQAKAGTISGVVTILAEVDIDCLDKRHSQGWLDEKFTDLDSLFKRVLEAQAAKEAVSLGYHGNIVEIWEGIVQRNDIKVSIGSDQTSCHNPYNGGYYPVDMDLETAKDMMVSDPPAYKNAVQASLRRHMKAIQTCRTRDGTLFFDYGNAFLLECHRAGCDVDPEIPSYVECIMGPEYFDYGFGPYRWVCTSGLAEELTYTDELAAEVLKEQIGNPENAHVLPQLKSNLTWIEQAGKNKLVVGSKARILYSDTIGRMECAVRMNRAVASGELSAPVVIGRDHHDVSGTDAPWRETANIKDGSNITADMSIQNVIGDAMRGATWVSIHNGGGTGWGMASNGGFGLVLDGSVEAEERAKDMIFFDVTNGLVRRARAGNPHAQLTIANLAKDPRFPKFQPFMGAVPK
jgi:urocanate hydratase